MKIHQKIAQIRKSKSEIESLDRNFDEKIGISVTEIVEFFLNAQNI